MAQLAPVIDKLEDVAEPARQFYKAHDGKFVVDLNGAPSGFVSAADLAAANARVVEFRDNNVALTKKVGELEPIVKKFEGLDADAARAALLNTEELKKKGIVKADDIATAIQTAVQAAVAPLTQQITSITTTAQENQKRADSMTLRQVLSDQFGKAGGVPEAIDFIVNKASGVFKVVDGKVVAETNQFSVDKPGEALSIAEWMTSQTKASSFAFKPSGGSGANPVPANGGPVRPAGQLVLKDPTPQQLGEHAVAIRQGKMRVEYSS